MRLDHLLLTVMFLLVAEMVGNLRIFCGFRFSLVIVPYMRFG